MFRSCDGSNESDDSESGENIENVPPTSSPPWLKRQKLMEDVESPAPSSSLADLPHPLAANPNVLDTKHQQIVNTIR